MVPWIASWRWPFVKLDFKPSLAKIDCKKWSITTKHCYTILHLRCSATFWVAIQPSVNWLHHTLLWSSQIHCRPPGWSMSPEPSRMGPHSFSGPAAVYIKCTKAGSPSCHPPSDCLSLIAILWPEIVSGQKDVSASPAFKKISLCQGGQDF